MTERKPPGVSFESFVDKQIREAAERGAFTGLTGAGKPLPGADEPYDENWWIKRKLHDEGVSVLPPALALRKEAEGALAAARAARSDAEARRILREINVTIEAALRRPLSGPPLNLTPFDVEQVVAERRARDAGG
ncbi:MULTISPECIES: J-domain-containing protein [unclassified Streptomyces]|uniref:DnaJ family domain-containing protein n=1 Tax=unclassified Streptomyces TaxID=2593676 RepID=UPI0022B65CDF|nr:MULTISPECIES: DUF1992 domain-containing protein [unclassified Streptomyces]MCZ7413490.1 DUF1992 domain-containing protein [Streptomyces sp. WMMC897]MCZ7430484.1 DUF1992 domain-containing protein [Streptomyces sp. WMMC1477]